MENDITRKFANEQPPLRAELFSIEQLENHGRRLAESHKIKTGYLKDKLLKRLADNERILIEIRNLLTEAIRDGRLITPAGEWLLDNFYLIEDNIHTGKKHLPKEYSESLPKLANTANAGLPRVYDIALEIISHSDGRLDFESLKKFISAYQEGVTLQIGELWAIPITLRLALIENLRRVSVRVAIDRINQNLADYWAGIMMKTAEQDPKSLIIVIADMARSGPPMESSFVAELIRQLIWKGPSLALPFTWLEQRLSETGLTSNELVTQENQKQAADQVSISNSINSLRFMESIDWKEFVEEMSAIEKTLRQDKGGVYPCMDFQTRDMYRHVIEKIAKYSPLSENEVAAIAIKLAAENKPTEATDGGQGHVGYYLIGDGLWQTENLAGSKIPFNERIQKSIRRHGLKFYAGSIVLISLFITFFLLVKAGQETDSAWILVLTGIISFLGASYLATSLVNWWSTLIFGPGTIARMDFSKGIPQEFSTMVVVPTVLMHKAQIRELVDMLEVRFLANRDKNLHFGLLTDFMDADQEQLPGDDELLEFAKRKIDELNTKYNTDNNTFFLFHRPRKWNPYDKIWMGYERKRGKLSELNALLRGKDKDYFSFIVGDTGKLPEVKYIITLDTDTQLPHDSGWKLTATMAHPLNRPVFDEKKQRIVKGYGLLQPRVSISLSRFGNSLYSLIHGNEPGIDPYTRTTSDVYQDLFDEGSFVGKGIYDVDIFERTLNGRLPENRVLSHDLLEGCYVRSGLLTDVQLYEEYPMRYSTDVNRRHRWIRGDWQIGFWALPIAPDANHKLRKNHLSALSRWKIFDNLRRSLVPVGLTLLLIFGWTILDAPLFWTLAVALIVIIQPLMTFVWSFFRKSNELTFTQHFVSTITAIADNVFRNLFMLACLPYEAYFSLDAIVRTIWRMTVSHKKLLEWNLSGRQEQTSERTLLVAYKFMWPSPFIALALLAFLIVCFPTSLFMATPFIIAWMLAPFIAWIISKPLDQSNINLSEDQTVFLRRIARKTWGFFEMFVGPADNWLPPDNFQEKSNVGIAHRTSPTNIGIALLGHLAAYDFGYITLTSFLERTTNTMNSLQKMERYKGHFYNWYDTLTLQPLPPRYISTVDSGNLAGHLLTLRQGILALRREKISFVTYFIGIRDTARVLSKEIPQNVLVTQLLTNVEFAINSQPLTMTTAKKYAGISLKYASEIRDSLIVQTDDVIWWADALLRHCKMVSDEISNLLPWLSVNPVPNKFLKFFYGIECANIKDISEMRTSVLPEIKDLQSQGNTESENEWLNAMSGAVDQAAIYAREQMDKIRELDKYCKDFADFEYEFLYDKTKHLLSIGYNCEEHKRDPGYYDLLASEANLCIFVGIAQGKIPNDSWFALGRLLAYGHGAPILLSWSGSMFEYLMPVLVMPQYGNTLLSQTYKNAVARQISYAAERKIPWGISESCYNAVDQNLNYQYRAFGVPGLGFKRGLAEDLVVAPYATVLALMVNPTAACSNLELLSSEGFEGRYGFYEAIDYTTSRLPRGQSKVIIQNFMAHHQAMSLLSLNNILLGHPMQKRFESELQFRSAMLLLQERVPKTNTFYTYSADVTTVESSVAGTSEIRTFTTPHTPIPEVQLLSNGKYHVMVTNAGGGYSKWKEVQVTRWHEDSTCDNWGAFCYIRDLEAGTYWSSTYQPVVTMPEVYEATFTQGRADFKRIENNIETRTEIVVSPEDDMEMRRQHVTNHSRRKRTLDITSYAEVVLAAGSSDTQHPAFSKLFVNTEIITQRHAIICQRRPSSDEEHAPWMFHMMTIDGASAIEISFETNRMEFIGRGNTVASPQAMVNPGPLSNSEGAVLDPIVSIRYQLTIAPDETVILDMMTGVCATRDECIALIEKYQDKNHKDRAFELAWTHSQVVLRQINASESDAQLYGKLASSVIFTNPLLRTDPATIIKNHRSQSGLWGYSISGDLPIILLELENLANINIVKQLVQAHTYWRSKGLAADLVIWNEDHGGYRQNLQNEILGLITAGIGSELTDHPGGIFVRIAEQISDEDRILFQSVARIVISDKKGTLEDHVNRKNSAKNNIPTIPRVQNFQGSGALEVKSEDLVFYNESGGFAPDGREYIINTNPGNYTPLPWANILTNPNFGSVISESGQSYTWVDNAHELRLTPWENDPVTDASGEVFYIRDEETGYYWSPAPLPACGRTPYVTRHGFGYSIFEHNEAEIETEMQVFADVEAAVKFFVIKLKNNSGRERHISATGYVEWVLGDIKSRSAMHIFTEVEPNSGALLGRNNYNAEFEGRVAFFDTDDRNCTFTCDRTEFIGRNSSLRTPDAMSRKYLSGKYGAALDPCAALQTNFVLADGENHTVIFRLGAGKNADDLNKILKKFKGIYAAKEALEKVQAHWRQIIEKIQVVTPNPALDVLVNGWLTYQVISSRLWARSGYYQSGGAYGFRDQLQDVLAVMQTEPTIAHDQIVLAASRQFKEGDVQHWWHPPVGRGVRTRCSDDLLWLPFVTANYIIKTGDTKILDENIAFLEGRPLAQNEKSYYDIPARSEEQGSLYEHCKRAIMHSLTYGVHGLPLMGTGDWNDGMDLVGANGRGESVWLGFFLYKVLTQFAPIANSRSDKEFSEKCTTESEQLKTSLEKSGWDGGWYRRAYFDNGDPLGSKENPECRIDSIAQSWAALSGAGVPEHVKLAVDAADSQLVDNQSNLIRLLTPPFDSSSLNPGYIKGYVPGIRENGGQYTHAAVWLIMAQAALGHSQRAWELVDMINPVNHSNTKEKVSVYKAEPYVIAADVYSMKYNSGRSGWTWYTGSAGWMYQLITEWLLGMRVEGNKLIFLPCIPNDWDSFKITYMHKNTRYHITVTQDKSAKRDMTIEVDGTMQNNKVILLFDDMADHTVIVTV